MPGEEMEDALGAAEPREGQDPHDVHVPGGEHRDGAGRRRGRRALPPPVRPARGARLDTEVSVKPTHSASDSAPTGRSSGSGRWPRGRRSSSGTCSSTWSPRPTSSRRSASTGVSTRSSSDGRLHPGVPVPDAAGRGRPARRRRVDPAGQGRVPSTRTWRSTTAAVSGRPSRSSRSRSSRGQAAAASPWPRTTSGCSRRSSGARPPRLRTRRLRDPDALRDPHGGSDVGWPRTATASAC